MIKCLWLALAFARCLCQFALSGVPGDLLVVNRSEPGATRVAIAQNQTQQNRILNIQWYPLNSASSAAGQEVFPRVTLHRVSRKPGAEPETNLTASSLYFEFTPDIQKLVDENFLPVRLLGEDDFLVEIQGEFAFSLQISSDTTAFPRIDADMVAILQPSDDRYEFKVDRSLGMLEGDKFCLLVHFGQGEELYTEATYNRKHQGVENLRRTEVSRSNLSSVYLMPFEIKENLTRVNLVIARKESSTRREIVMKVRLVKIHAKSQVNLVSLYQALENADHPLGISLRLADRSRLQRSIDLSDQPYFLNLSGLQKASNYRISMIFVHGSNTSSTTFRRLSGFDKALLDWNPASSNLSFGTPQTQKISISKRAVLNITEFETEHNITSSFSYFKKVLIKSSFEKHVLDSGDIFSESVTSQKYFNLLLILTIVILTAALTVGLVLLLFQSKIKDKKAPDTKKALRQRVEDLDEMKKIVADFETKTGVELVSERKRQNRHAVVTKTP